jgi:hypothetical protein
MRCKTIAISISEFECGIDYRFASSSSSPEKFFKKATRVLKSGVLLVIGFEPNRWPYFTVYPALRLLGRLIYSGTRKNAEDVSIGDMETEGFVAKDFKRFF